MAVLDSVHLSDAANRPLKTYSGGMKRRIGLAQALLGQPQLVIVDEPTAGLDPEERVRIRNLLSTIAMQCTVILSTHIIEDISQSCRDLVVLNQGRIRFRGSPHDLISEVRGQVWLVTTPDQRPTGDLIMVLSRQQQDTTQYRLLGRPAAHYHPVPVEPSLEDGYIWLMSQT
jgi:ABC-type multidrug transport system ATPase subunit